MRYQYRVTKYDPANRDENGAYLVDEWTAMSDIGKVFCGRRLDREEYLRVEDAHVAAVEGFLQEAGLSSMLLKGIEKPRDTVLPRFAKEGASLSIPQCGAFARLALRCEVWARLVVPRRAYVHFGYDYSMFVGVPVACPRSIAAARENGLFVEPFRSPYLRARSGERS